jgi:DNA polymerase III subunit beta
MRVIIERAALLKSLNHVQSVVERRNTIPILSNVLIQADAGTIRLTATDLDLEIVESVAADVAQPGATTVPAHMMYDIVRKLPDGAQLELVQGPDEGRLSVFSGRSRFQLQALPPQDFPDLTAGELTHRFEVPGQGTEGPHRQTRFAVSTEETRYYLNGIYLHDVAIEPAAMLRAVATDGHRLAQAQVECPEGAAACPA